MSKSKKNIFIVVTIIILILVGAYFILNKTKEGGSTISLGQNKITSDKIKEYGINSTARWGDLALNISYKIPDMEYNTFNGGHGSVSYEHGHCFAYNKDGSRILVEKSLEGCTDLNILPKAINDEKNSNEYKYIIAAKEYFDIESTKNIKINNFDTVYFESKQIVYSSEYAYKYIGYSFVYDNQYFSVYGKYSINNEKNDGEENKDFLNKRLQFVIDSIEPYHGESFYELDENYNLKKLYDSHTINGIEKQLDENEKQFVLNSYKGNRYDNNIYSSSCYKFSKGSYSWDGKYDTILNAYIADNERKNKISIYNLGYGETKCIDEDVEEINGIKMKKYIVNNKHVSIDSYAVLYTFVVDDHAYIIEIYLGLSGKINPTESQKSHIIKSLDITADTIIRTIRFIERDNDDELKKYVNR